MRLRYTLTALRQIDAALSYVRERSPGGAAGIRDRIASAAVLLADHPRLGQATSDPAVRRVVLSPYPYVLYYRVLPDGVVVTRLRHAARKPIP